MFPLQILHVTWCHCRVEPEELELVTRARLAPMGSALVALPETPETEAEILVWFFVSGSFTLMIASRQMSSKRLVRPWHGKRYNYGPMWRSFLQGIGHLKGSSLQGVKRISNICSVCMAYCMTYIQSISRSWNATLPWHLFSYTCHIFLAASCSSWDIESFPGFSFCEPGGWCFISTPSLGSSLCQRGSALTPQDCFLVCRDMACSHLFRHSSTFLCVLVFLSKKCSMISMAGVWISLLPSWMMRWWLPVLVA